jgi:ubiquinone/menaquinone biosynthesis C-methylase UbiE
MPRSVRHLRDFGQRLNVPPRRSDDVELLDGAILDRDELAQNFRDIRRVNHLLGGTAAVLRHLPSIVASLPDDRPVAILDLATGSGDIPVAIARWAARHDRAVEIVASDSSEEILALAREHTAGYPGIELARYDARHVPLPDDSFDIVLCSLSLHHFAPDDAMLVLREMHRLARTGFILNDLVRSRIGYAAAWVAARLTTRNRLTRNDAPLSVRRAYTPAELASMLRCAGIDTAVVSTHPWFRMTAVCRRSRHDR